MTKVLRKATKHLRPNPFAARSRCEQPGCVAAGAGENRVLAAFGQQQAFLVRHQAAKVVVDGLVPKVPLHPLLASAIPRSI
ncbi:hypothetical protein IVA95_36715 [Bradyrhizobium sp. 157]|uniref:hypothetical protein n=1 Tax=Bradyrhizobium sp. 157 TaxID=2782631 RepID=UPI001FFB5165|nr:hypothetical protein [Bradyrhizobium sp. 157]MCK1642956.1 hypothetical protein [Bradyrhizobium sp. 157]